MSTELDNVDPWEPGDHLTAEGLNERSGGGIRSISTGGNLRHTQTGNHVDLYVPPSTAGAPAAALTHFPARLIDAQSMQANNMICDQAPDAVDTRGTFFIAGRQPHAHRFKYSFVEVRFVETCGMDESGALQICPPDSSAERTILYEDKPAEAGGRSGRWKWPDGGLPASQKWAFNVWEFLHKQEDEICRGGIHWIFGAPINAPSYPPNFSPKGPGGAGGLGQGYYRDENGIDKQSTQGGQWNAGNQDFMVLMYETTDKNGSMIRYFNAPGIHLGGCHA